MKRGAACRRSASGGMTLVEVLVALLVFSIGLVGMATLQARALSYSMSAEDTNRAALLANEMAVQMLTSQTVVIAATRLDAWKARVADTTGSGLPNGSGDVSVDPASGLATITVLWRPPGLASGAPNAQSRYVTQFKVVN